MYDSLIRGALIYDGTGSPPRRGDLAIEGSRIAEIGDLEVSAAEVIDADGLCLAPGFIDPHCHYDAQVLWDPMATPSSHHGVTTVINGNCGFTLAPVRAEDRDYLTKMLSQVEGMPLSALEAGIPWTWESFGGYLDSVDGRLGVNAGFMVGHSALRLFSLGKRAFETDLSDDDITSMASALGDALGAGALGFSTSRASTHLDGNGEPVPSRWASDREILRLCAVAGEFPGTCLEAIVEGCLAGDGFSDEDAQFLCEMTRVSNRVLNWNVLMADASNRERTVHQLLPSRLAESVGQRIVALTMPVDAVQTQSFLNHCGMQMLPGWQEVFRLPVGERMEQLRQPSVRSALLEGARSPQAGVLARHAGFDRLIIGDTFSPSNAGLSGRFVEDIARERAEEPFDALVDIVLADELRTVLWPERPQTPELWELRAELWKDPSTVLGGSDAGAHLDRTCGSTYTTRFLAEMLRGVQLVPVERAIQMLTSEPAGVFGLRDRGLVEPGYYADLVLFDPATVGSEPVRTVGDLPGGASRLTASATGIERVFVNGSNVVTEGVATGLKPGAVIRSGRDTASRR